MEKSLIFIFLIAIILISGCTAITDLFKTCEDEIIYTEWTECSNNLQMRIKKVFSCNDNSLISEEVEQRSCVVPCVSNWSCTNWSDCPKIGIQTRSCTNLANCTNYSNIPITSQSCIFNNPCLNITDSDMKERCNSLVYKNSDYCYNLTKDIDFDSCFFSYAYIYSQFAVCDLINGLVSRYTCEAIVSLQDSYCNKLPPENRSECLYELDLRYDYLAAVNSNPDLCNNIKNSGLKSNCLIKSQPYSNYRQDLSKCQALFFDNSSINYQDSRACYIYHIKESSNPLICNNVSDFMKNDCKALINYNLKYCYDKSGYQRDWCMANFAYYYNDIRLCRDASNEENCIYTLGFWFKDNDYCQLLTNQTKKNACISAYIAYCEENIGNCPSMNYCSLITDASPKNLCIIRSVENEIKYKNKEW